MTRSKRGRCEGTLLRRGHEEGHFHSLRYEFMRGMRSMECPLGIDDQRVSYRSCFYMYVCVETTWLRTEVRRPRSFTITVLNFSGFGCTEKRCCRGRRFSISNGTTKRWIFVSVKCDRSFHSLNIAHRIVYQ